MCVADPVPLAPPATAAADPSAVSVVEKDKSNDSNGTTTKTKPLSLREAKIVKLNDRVDTIVQKACNKGNSSKTDDDNNEDVPIHIRLAQRPMTVLYSGAPIYQLRFGWLVYGYAAFSAILMVAGLCWTSHPAAALLALALVYVGYDLHSGVLHVVFDHPENVHLPIIGQACLEFQWHHSISDDIVRKDFVDVCGDLNVVVGLLIVIHLSLLDLTNPVSLLIGGTKIAMAYFGQFSHKSSHRINNNGSLEQRIAKGLQQAGIMVSNRDHAAHHKEPYDQDFCLIGLCNPIIDAARKYVTTSNTAWLVAFFLLSVFDLTVYAALVNALFPQQPLEMFSWTA